MSRRPFGSRIGPTSSPRGGSSVRGAPISWRPIPRCARSIWGRTSGSWIASRSMRPRAPTRRTERSGRTHPRVGARRGGRADGDSPGSEEWMALEQKLNLRMTQKLIMTPSLQQAIKLLQMTKLELQEEVTQELTENPLLEEQQDGTQEADKPEGEDGPAGDAAAVADAETPEPEREKDPFDEIDYESYFQDYMDLSYRPQAPAEEIEAPPLENILSRPQSLYDYLLWQLDMSIVPGKQKEIVRAIVGNLDEDGYLRVSLEDIAAMGPFAQIGR